MTELILASASPRRAELLRQLGVRHRVEPADVDESVWPDEAPEAYVRRVTAAKAAAGAARAPGRAVLAADTAVLVGTELFGKPRDQREGLAMLETLSGRVHHVLTAVALAVGPDVQTALSSTAVTFRATTAAERLRYWQTGEPQGKAGGYAVQGYAAAFITRLDGSYSGVMGLPLAETAALLTAAGIGIWDFGAQR